MKSNHWRNIRVMIGDKLIKTTTLLYEIDEVAKIAKNTPYPEEDLIEFMKLTGLNIDKTKSIMEIFNKIGISNIKDVNKLVIMGYFRYE